MKKSAIFEVFEEKGKRRNLYTKALVPGPVYGEIQKKEKNETFRNWDPYKSKLAAAILCGASNVFIRKDAKVLYLGASTGTTVSHVSDMVGKNGLVFALDPAPIVLRELIFLAQKRKNIAPILADANHPLEYAHRICQVDILYQDVAQKNQVEIFLKNAKLALKKGGYGLLAVKARSINVTKRPKEVYKQVFKELEEANIKIVDSRKLDPYQKDHMMFICKF